MFINETLENFRFYPKVGEIKASGEFTSQNALRVYPPAIRAEIERNLVKLIDKDYMDVWKTNYAYLKKVR